MNRKTKNRVIAVILSIGLIVFTFLISIQGMLNVALNNTSHYSAGGIVYAKKEQPSRVCLSEAPADVSSRLIVQLKKDTDPLTIAEQAGAKLVRKGPLNFATLEIPAGGNLKTFSKKIENLQGVLSVQPSKLFQVGTTKTGNVLNIGFRKTDDSAQVRTADTGFVGNAGNAKQWGLQKIRAPQAWQVGATGKGVIIAVVDTGVDVDNPDLKENLVSGYNAMTQDTSWSAVQDYNGHGTHVAGIAAAGLNSGMAGVAYNARIMPIKAMDKDGEGSDDTIASGIVWAADNGANIINLSLGAANKDDIIGKAIKYAQSKGCLVVAAAGNREKNTPAGAGISYPASAPNVIAVTATDQNDQIASFSLTGPQAVLSAPGVNIWSDYWDNGPVYASLDGTSMAAAFVSGVAALVWGMHPNWTAQQVSEDLENTAIGLGSPGRNNDYGYGRVDAYRAVAAAAQPDEYSASTDLHWAGGIVKSSDGNASLRVPPGAFPLNPGQSVNVQVTEAASEPDFPPGVTPAGPAYSLQWGTEAAQHMLTLALKSQSVPSDEVLNIYRWSGQRWLPVGGGGTGAMQTIGVFYSGLYRAGYAPMAEYSRLAGADRIETAIRIAQAAFPSGADTVILARADEFPDALAGAPLAYKEGAPILLTYPNELPPTVLAEIMALAPQKIILLGGSGAISESIANQLAALATVQRLAGTDRYGTAAAIAQAMGMRGQAVIANGDNFPDALGVAAIAARQGEPVLLTPASGLPESTKSELRLLSVTQTLVAGGPGVVLPAVLGYLPAANRLAGSDRYGTAAAILQAYPPIGQTVYLATGENFPDALSGGILAALQETDIMLVPPGGPTSAERAMLQNWQEKKIVALGGSGVISDAELQALQP